MILNKKEKEKGLAYVMIGFDIKCIVCFDINIFWKMNHFPKIYFLEN